MIKAKRNSFEDSLNRLQAIVDEMDAEHTTLEKTLTLYEEGLTLLQECAEQLNGARKRLLELKERADNTFLLLETEDPI